MRVCGRIWVGDVGASLLSCNSKLSGRFELAFLLSVCRRLGVLDGDVI